MSLKKVTPPHVVHGPIKNDVPAGEGVPWRDGHIHGHALRQIKREFLRDLYDFTLQL